MTNSITLTKAMQRGLGGFPHERLNQEAIADWQYCIEQQKNNSAKQNSNNNANLSQILKQISQWKKELDQSFSEFGDLQETLANYNLYRQLDSLQKQIRTLL